MKIRVNSSLYGVTSFSVKERDWLRDVVDHQALNKNSKINNTPISRADETFGRTWSRKNTSRIDFSTTLHHTRLKSENI